MTSKQKRNAASQRFKDKHRAAGLCISCVNPALPGFLLCSEHREKRRVNNIETRIRNPERNLLARAKHRAKVKGIPFSITAKDITIPERCPILGIVLKRDAHELNGASPSLDKIIPSLGYVPGNVQVISRKANCMKSNATLEEVAMLGRWAENVLRGF